MAKILLSMALAAVIIVVAVIAVWLLVHFPFIISTLVIFGMVTTFAYIWLDENIW